MYTRHTLKLFRVKDGLQKKKERCEGHFYVCPNPKKVLGEKNLNQCATIGPSPRFNKKLVLPLFCALSRNSRERIFFSFRTSVPV